MKICYIVGAMGGALPPEIKNADFLIAADGGFETLKNAGLRPNLVVGDFDSLGYVPEGENVLHVPKEKDDTDMLLAMKKGLEQGCRGFVILGGLGGRLDHTVGNIQALAYIADRGARGCLVGENENVLFLKDGTAAFDGLDEGPLSVFAYGGPARGVTLAGLKYPLENAEVSPFVPVGVSNEFTGQPAKVTVRDGCLLIIWRGRFTEELLEK